jgi:zinc protease
MGRVLYGDRHPYALAATIGAEDVVAALTPADLQAEHAEWFRPDVAQITVVGDIDMAHLLPLLEGSFGQWTARNSAAPAKAIDAPAPAPVARLVVVDRPNSPQSVVILGHLLPLTGTQAGLEPLELANEVIGNGFLSRLNNDLRETRGWTYGVRSAVSQRVGQPAFTVSTSVQADRTGDSIKVILDQLAAFPGSRPVDEVELQRVTDGNIRGLPNRFETNGQVMGALLTNQLLGRPDDYQAQLPAIYGAIDADEIDAAARTYMRPDNMAIVVVGDRAVIEPQLAQLGLPVEFMEADGL